MPSALKICLVEVLGNELYKEENQKLNVILVELNAPLPVAGKENLTEWMLPHALEVICQARRISEDQKGFIPI